MPVIDPSIAALERAGYAALLKRQCGWVPSRKWSCETPPEEEIAAFGGFDEESASGKRIVVAPDRAGTRARWRLRTRIGRKTIPANIQRGHSPCSGLG